MKLIAVVISIGLMIPTVWGQKYPKRPAALGGPGPVKLTLKAKSFKAHPRMASPRQTSGPAPLVVQVYVVPSGISASVTAYAIATTTIPANTQIGGSMVLLDDNSAIDFQQTPLQNALNPGDFIQLPVISNFGDVWNPGAFAYIVTVTPTRGATTQAEGDFVVNETLSNADLPNFLPIVGSATQSINNNKDVIMALPGYYSGNPVQVVLTDASFSYVVPGNAVMVSGSEVDVDLSLVPGIDLSSLDEFLVTVDEDGFDSTVAFRYLPPPPNAYNPAPSM